MTNKKSILIAGASGLIGQELVLALISEGYMVNVISRNIEITQKQFHSSINVYSWQGLNMQGQHIKHADVIINLAGANVGAKPWSHKYKDLLYASRKDSISNLAIIVKELEKPPELWLQASAIGYYGYNINFDTDESGKQGDGFLADLVSKWEQNFNELELPATKKLVLRFGLVMSEKGGVLKQILDPLKYRIAICPGKGKNYLSYIHIADLVNYFITCIGNNSIEGVVNMVSKKPVKMIDFIGSLKEKHKAKIIIKVPAFLLKIVLGNEKAKELVLADQKVVSSVLN